MPDRLRRAVEAAQGITQNVARKREIQYVGKLLRDIDVDPIRDALEALDNAGRIEAARQHRLERWRDALVEQGDPLLHRLAQLVATVDRQKVRQLLMRARRERDADRPPKAARELFRVLREYDRLENLPETVPPTADRRDPTTKTTDRWAPSPATTLPRTAPTATSPADPKTMRPCP